MIHVIANIQTVSGRRDEFIEAFKRLVPEVLQEDGCHAYGPTVDVPTGHPGQPPVREDMVVVIEQWASVDALNAHHEAPHMQAFRESRGHLIAGLTLYVTDDEL